MLPILAFIGLVFYALLIVPLWIALKKAGLAGPLSLIALIPTLGLIIVLFILAFARWKVVPAPEYAYPPQIPPPGYPAAYPVANMSSAPPATGYANPGAYTPAPPTYPPPPEPPTNR